MLAEKLLPVIQQALVDIDDGALSVQERDAIKNRVIDLQQFLDLISTATWKANPMLFSMLAYVYVRNGEFPHAKVILYSRLIDGMISLRSADKSKSAILTKKLYTAELAYILFDQDGEESHQTVSGDAAQLSIAGGKVYEEAQLIDLLSQMNLSQLSIAEMMEIIKESGLMEPISDNRFIFRHQSFQDYLVGVWITDRLKKFDEMISDPMLDKMKKMRTQERWSEPLRYMVGELFSGNTRVQGVGVNWLNDIASEYQQISRSLEIDQLLVLLFLLMGSIAEIPDLEQKVDALSQTATPLDLPAYMQLWIDAIAR